MVLASADCLSTLLDKAKPLCYSTPLGGQIRSPLRALTNSVRDPDR